MSLSYVPIARLVGASWFPLPNGYAHHDIWSSSITYHKYQRCRIQYDDVPVTGCVTGAYISLVEGNTNYPPGASGSESYWALDVACNYPSMDWELRSDLVSMFMDTITGGATARVYDNVFCGEIAFKDASLTVNHWAEGECDSESGPDLGPMVRVDKDTNSCYRVWHQTLENAISFSIIKRVSGVETELVAYPYAITGGNYTVGPAIRLGVFDNTLYLSARISAYDPYEMDISNTPWIDIGTYTDTNSPLTTGVAGSNNDLVSWNAECATHMSFGNMMDTDLHVQNITVGSTIESIILEFNGGTFVLDGLTLNPTIDTISIVQPPGMCRTLTGSANIRNIDGTVPDIYTLGGTKWN